MPRGRILSSLMHFVPPSYPFSRTLHRKANRPISNVSSKHSPTPRGKIDKIICHDADFSLLIFGYRMAAALHSGQFSMYPTEDPLADRRRSIGIFIMLRCYQHGDEYLADLERENTIRDEHLLVRWVPTMQ